MNARFSSARRTPLLLWPLILAFCITVKAASTTVLNVTVPTGTVYKPAYDLLCLAAKPSDVFIFFAANYLAHAATVKSFPGESTAENIASLLFALLYPASGIVRGLDAIFRHAVFTEHELQRAAQAGALCMVVRSNLWTPAEASLVKDCNLHRTVVPRRNRVQEHVAANAAEQNGGIELDDLNRIKPQSFMIYTPRWMTEYLTNWIYCDTLNVYVQPERKVHGLGRLPKGYRLAYVPRDAVVAFKWDEDPLTPENSGASSWSIQLFFSKTWVLIKKTTTAIKTWFRALRRSAPEDEEKSGVVSSSYALPKVLIALFQLVYGALSLADSRGDQINQFGYAAFGLTVAVYTVMAGINLIGHLLTPDYSTLFVVHNEVIVEIMHRHDLPDVDKRFADGVVGRLIAADDKYRTSNYQPRQLFHGRFTDVAELQGATFQVALEVDGLPETPWVLRPRDTYSERSTTRLKKLAIPTVQIPACPLFKRKLQLYGSTSRPLNTSIGPLLGGREVLEQGTNPQPRPKTFYGFQVYGGAVILVGLLCFAIIASFSQMKNYKSTQAQRGWTMSWFIFGIFAGYTIPLGVFGVDSPLRFSHLNIIDLQERLSQSSYWEVVGMLIFVGPTIGGLVVVAQMINAYGSCVKLE